jgi:glycosyltransferase involved in cell wall biosynthesis
LVIRSDTETVEIVLPVHNEAQTLETTIARLRDYLDDCFPFLTVVTIADNASTDRTHALARSLADRLDGVQAVHLDEKGRGRALRTSWAASQAKVVAYMDADLATGLDALLPLVAPLLSGHSDVAIGSRLTGGAHVVRGPRRELISRCYNALLHVALGSRFSDAQCGFKAMRADAARLLLPLVEDNEWFFDTELLVLVERNGLRIHEVPVDWIDDPDSRVDIVRTAVEDLRGIWRLLTTPTKPLDLGPRPSASAPCESASLVARFAGIGIVSTVAYVALFLVFGQWLGRYGSNALALALCTAANTWAHYRLVVPRAARPSGRDVLVAGTTLFAVILALTTAGLALAGLVDPSSKLLEVGAIAIATAAAALLRFVVIHAWSSRRHRRMLGAQVTADAEITA